MKSVTTERFRKSFEALPESVKIAASKTYKIWKLNPRHPSIQFKKIHKTKPIYSVRITISWRALGVRKDNAVIWFWIGSHSDYDKLIEEMR